jgi:signal transduction histidine kinase/DNA-binding NarL/FixJ family response regulator
MTQQSTKLLLVEQSVSDAGRVKAAISEASGVGSNFELVHVSQPADALKYLHDTDFDLLLLDLSLSHAAPIDALLQIQDAAPALPILVVTELNDQDLAIEAVRKGAQDYLVKSDLDSRMLVRAIRHAIERKRIDAQLQHQRERQAVLHEVNLAITSTLDPHSVLDIFLEKISRLLPDFAITVRLVNLESGNLQPFACRNVNEKDWKEGVAAEGRSGRAKAVMAAGKPIILTDALNDANTSNRDFLRRNQLVSYVGVPLVAQGESLGVIGFYTRERHEFTDEEVELLATLAGQAAVAIHNSQLYERLKTTNEALEKTLEIKGVLVGVMAHELKTPLQVIMGAASLLSTGVCGKLNDDQRERLRAIEAAADELRELIDSTLSMASLERGKTPLMISEVRVSMLLAELKSEFSEVFRKKKIELQIDMPPDEFTIKTDRIKLKEIFRNLLENARKFTPKGKVKVRFLHKPSDRRVEFAVTDTGIGIKKELLPKIFDLFYQADPALQTEYASAGLGLSIVKRLVTAMSGEIDVSSEVGKGTTVRVSLPVEISSLNFS